MDRRAFLRFLGGAAPVAAVAPTYFFHPAQARAAAEIFGIPYYQTKPPYIGDEYMGISRNRAPSVGPKLVKYPRAKYPGTFETLTPPRLQGY